MNIMDISAFLWKNDEYVERWVLDIDGHDVQIIRYDQNNNDMLVKVDNFVCSCGLQEVDNQVMSRL